MPRKPITNLTYKDIKTVIHTLKNLSTDFCFPITIIYTPNFNTTDTGFKIIHFIKNPINFITIPEFEIFNHFLPSIIFNFIGIEDTSHTLFKINNFTYINLIFSTFQNFIGKFSKDFTVFFKNILMVMIKHMLFFIH